MERRHDQDLARSPSHHGPNLIEAIGRGLAQPARVYGWRTLNTGTSGDQDRIGRPP